MLGKLMKYEWRGYRFPMMIMLIILAGTTLLTCGIILTINPEYDEVMTGYSVAALMLSIFLYYFGIIGCALGTMLIICIRFYKTCYTDQGYLTHTLPVSSKQLLNAKTIMAVLTYLLLLLSIAVSIGIIIMVTINHIISLSPEDADLIRRELAKGFSEFTSEFSEEFGISLGLYLTYLIVYFTIACVANIITIMGCVSLGQLYAKHRIIGAIAAYFVVNFVMQIIGYISTIPMYAKMINADKYGSDITPFGLMSPSMNITLVISVLLAVGMYFVNLHMMTKKLNLE